LLATDFVAAALVAAALVGALVAVALAVPFAGALVAGALALGFAPEGLAVLFLAVVFEVDFAVDLADGFAVDLAAGALAGVFLADALLPEVALAAVPFFGAAFADVTFFRACVALVVPAGDFFTAVNSTSLRDLPVVPRTAPEHCGTDVPLTSTSG
jgi:hypothetical protein